MDVSSNGDRPDLTDRLLELRSDNVSFNKCAAILAAEGYVVRGTGNPLTPQGCAARARVYEQPLQLVHEGGDLDQQVKLFLQVLMVGTRNPGPSGEMFKSGLQAYKAAIKARKGRFAAAQEAVEVCAKARTNKKGQKKKKEEEEWKKE